MSKDSKLFKKTLLSLFVSIAMGGTIEAMAVATGSGDKNISPPSEFGIHDPELQKLYGDVQGESYSSFDVKPMVKRSRGSTPVSNGEKTLKNMMVSLLEENKRLQSNSSVLHNEQPKKHRQKIPTMASVLGVVGDYEVTDEEIEQTRKDLEKLKSESLQMEPEMESRYTDMSSSSNDKKSKKIGSRMDNLTESIREIRRGIESGSDRNISQSQNGTSEEVLLELHNSLVKVDKKNKENEKFIRKMGWCYSEMEKAIDELTDENRRLKLAHMPKLDREQKKRYVSRIPLYTKDSELPDTIKLEKAYTKMVTVDKQLELAVQFQHREEALGSNEKIKKDIYKFKQQKEQIALQIRLLENKKSQFYLSELERLKDKNDRMRMLTYQREANVLKINESDKAIPQEYNARINEYENAIIREEREYIENKIRENKELEQQKLIDQYKRIISEKENALADKKKAVMNRLSTSKIYHVDIAPDASVSDKEQQEVKQLQREIEKLSGDKQSEKKQVQNLQDQLKALQQKQKEAEEIQARLQLALEETGRKAEDKKEDSEEEKEILVIPIQVVPHQEPMKLAVTGKIIQGKVPQRAGIQMVGENSKRIHAHLKDQIQEKMLAAGDGAEREEIWGSYIHSNGKQNNKGSIKGYSSRLDGVTIGADANMVDSPFSLGAVFSAAKSRVNVHQAADSVSSDFYLLSLYGNYAEGKCFIDGIVSYGIGMNDYQSVIQGKKNKATGDSKTYGLSLSTGYNYALDPQWSLQPRAEFNCLKADVDAYKMAKTRYKAKSLLVTELGLGTILSGNISLEKGVLTPELSLMGYHDFNGGDMGGTAVADGQSLKLKGLKRNRNRGVAGAGVSYSMDNNLTLGLDYNYDFSKGYRADSLKASVGYLF
ncbi:putative surface cell antigen sca2 [invertebrate metagenome]|uniref:Putative surface cell antigen sca2 n=1 Tax=invertebrate metagenome TaxID=1711999 RepID=A0A2H9TAT1_9ZZZZ